MKQMLSGAVFLIALGLLPAFTRADEYTVDTVHSSIVFKVKRDGITHFRGRFNAFSGKITFDAAHPERSVATIEVKASSLDTGNGNRDKGLHGADLFASDRFPVIGFGVTNVKARKSKPVRGEPRRFTATGVLSFRGVNKPIPITFDFLGEKRDDKGNGQAGFETTFVFNRRDFGMTGMGNIGDEAEVTVSLAARIVQPPSPRPATPSRASTDAGVAADAAAR